MVPSVHGVPSQQRTVGQAWRTRQIAMSVPGGPVPVLEPLPSKGGTFALQRHDVGPLEGGTSALWLHDLWRWDFHPSEGGTSVYLAAGRAGERRAKKSV
jgi:hypothetical protein